MAFNLSTPESKLAWKIAARTQAMQDARAQLERRARTNVTAQLAPYGQSVDDYNSEFTQIYDPVAQQQQSQAAAMQKYVTGLPELLSRARNERSSNSAGGGSNISGGSPFVSTPYDPYTVMKYLVEMSKPKTTPFQRSSNADRFG